MLGGLITLTLGHGQLVLPRPRNSIDYLVGVNDPNGHRCANVTGDKCQNGQSSFWYSQGCFIGCEECDHVSGRRQTDLCESGMKPTNNGAARSLNRNATPNAPNDIYRHNPWRAPGFAPVGDACGFAGGTPWGPNVPEEGVYTNTSFAHHGMRGTSLPKLPDGVPPAKWTIGGEAEVAWNVRNNHGGGYSYRLCPSNEPLTEECFQRHPLEFVTDKQAIVLSNGTRTAHAALHATPLSDRCWPCVYCCCRYSHQHTGHLHQRRHASKRLDVGTATHPGHGVGPALPTGASRHEQHAAWLHALGGERRRPLGARRWSLCPVPRDARQRLLALLQPRVARQGPSARLPATSAGCV